MNHEELVAHLISNGVLRTPRIVEAFRKIDRENFVPDELKPHAHVDTALPIGYGQTISQPYTVAFMLELLQPERSEKILDLGSGSGWTTALLATIVGENGHVLGIEVREELAAFGARNLAKYNVSNGEIRVASDELGAPDKAPFDRSQLYHRRRRWHEHQPERH